MARTTAAILVFLTVASVADAQCFGGRRGGGILARLCARVRGANTAPISTAAYTPPSSLSNVQQFGNQNLCVDCLAPDQTTVYPGTTTVHPGATTTYQQPATVYSTPPTVVSTPSTVQRIVQAAPRIIERVVEQPRSTTVVESQPRVVERVIESPQTQVIQERVIEKSTTPAATQTVVECPPVDYDRIARIVEQKVDAAFADLRVNVEIISGNGRVLYKDRTTL